MAQSIAEWMLILLTWRPGVGYSSILLALANSYWAELPTLRNNLPILFPGILIDSCDIVLGVEFCIWVGLNEKFQRTSLWVLSYQLLSLFKYSSRWKAGVCWYKGLSPLWKHAFEKFGVFFFYCKIWKVKWRRRPATDHARTLLKKDSFSLFSIWALTDPGAR